MPRSSRREAVVSAIEPKLGATLSVQIGQRNVKMRVALNSCAPVTSRSALFTAVGRTRRAKVLRAKLSAGHRYIFPSQAFLSR
jgi:hypothetical protein